MNPHQPPLVWPKSLKRPATCRPLVYLDFNHWIGLAQAATGHAQGDVFKPALETCRALVASGNASFVLAGSHYFEILKVSKRQRPDLADVMEALTGFKTLVSRVVVMKLARLTRERPRP